MILFPGRALETWEPTCFLNDLKSAGFDSCLFERDDLRPDRTLVFHPDSKIQETLLRLFVEGSDLDEADVSEALAGSFRELIELGLLLRVDRKVKSNLRLKATVDGVFADDFSSRLNESPEDYVMGVAPTTQMVKALVPSGDHRRILDLCCGGGWLAIKLKNRENFVTGTDLNSRAIEIARFNARLNGVEGIDWREGSWYEKVEGEKFDLIISNPPFVVSPGNQAVALDTENNETVIPAVLGGIASRLNENGYACMLLDWPFLDVENWSEVPLGSFDCSGLQVLLFEIKRNSPEEYARHWVGQDPRFSESNTFRTEVNRWVEFLNQKGYQGISSGFFVARKCAPGDEWIMEESRGLAQFNETTSVDLSRIFEGRTWLTKNSDDLLDLRFNVADGLIQSSQSILNDGRWEVANLKLTSAGLVAYDGHIDEALLQIINAASSGGTIRELLPDLAKPLGVDPGAISVQVTELVKELVSLGVILPKRSA